MDELTAVSGFVIQASNHGETGDLHTPGAVSDLPVSTVQELVAAKRNGNWDWG